MGACCCPCSSQKNDQGTYNPSCFTLCMATSKTTKYVKQDFAKDRPPSDSGQKLKPILVVCTDERDMEMKNGRLFSTGNHPVEMLVPMLHFRDVGFSFDIATATGGAVKMEEWAFPSKDKNVIDLRDTIQGMLDAPKKLSDISPDSFATDYSSIFIPGGHGCMINLPFSENLGALLRVAHEKNMPTVTLCHGPAALLSTVSGKFQTETFPYRDYEAVCFTDKTDAFTPSVGYLPGHMPWKLQQSLEEKGMKVLNKKESGRVHQDRELITGDSPDAANNLGKFAAPILLKRAVDQFSGVGLG